MKFFSVGMERRRVETDEEFWSSEALHDQIEKVC